MDLDVASLAGLARFSLAISCLIFVLACGHALAGRGADRAAHGPALRWLFGYSVLMGVPALVLSLPALSPWAIRVMPVGLILGLAVAFLSLAHGPTRQAFDAIDDGSMRSLLGYRATFGAFLIGGAAVGLFPPLFAWTAGLGDLAVSWLAHAAPGSIGRGGSRGWRSIVHGVGLLDLVEVVFMAMTVVRPWLAENGSLGPPLVLPWLGVPLMLALNLHGLRRALADGKKVGGHLEAQHA